MSSIYHRISVRVYEDRPVEEEKILEILKAAMQSPSADNQQPWEFYVVTDKEVLKKLSETHMWTGMVAKAPVCIVPAYRMDSSNPAYRHIDMSACMENLWLRTDELGLGGVWCGIAPHEHLQAKVEEAVGMAKNHRAFALFPLGYPAESRPQEDRWDEARIHWVK